MGDQIAARVIDACAEHFREASCDIAQVARDGRAEGLCGIACEHRQLLISHKCTE